MVVCVDFLFRVSASKLHERQKSGQKGQLYIRPRTGDGGTITTSEVSKRGLEATSTLPERFYPVVGRTVDFRAPRSKNTTMV
jgi:hypothetical protein